MTESRYSQQQLESLAHDKVFQDRVARDAELQRHFDPIASEDAETRASELNALGAPWKIAGIVLPPPTLGVLRLLAATGSQFTKSARTFDDLIGEITLALAVLKSGSEAVGALTMIARLDAALLRHKPLAEKSAEHFDRLLRMEKECATAHAEWDARVAEIALRVKAAAGEQLQDIVSEIDAYLMSALDGFDRLPQIEKRKEEGAAIEKRRSFLRAVGRRISGVVDFLRGGRAAERDAGGNHVAASGADGL